MRLSRKPLFVPGDVIKFALPGFRANDLTLISDVYADDQNAEWLCRLCKRNCRVVYKLAMSGRLPCCHICHARADRRGKPRSILPAPR